MTVSDQLGRPPPTPVWVAVIGAVVACSLGVTVAMTAPLLLFTTPTQRQALVPRLGSRWPLPSGARLPLAPYSGPLARGPPGAHPDQMLTSPVLEPAADRGWLWRVVTGALFAVGLLLGRRVALATYPPAIAMCAIADPAASGPVTVTLTSGLTMTCETAGPPAETTPADQPFIIFVHGSLHGAWCWTEHWMPYLAARGVCSVAVNLRGTAGAMPAPEYNGGKRKVLLKDHVQDLAEIVHRFTARYRRPVALVGHSFGALYLMKLMERPDVLAMVPALAPPQSRLAGLALLCPVPAGGNGPMIGRLMRSRPVLALKITWGFVAKGLLRSAALCRDIFFSPNMPDSLITGYMTRFQQDGVYSLDLVETNANLPILVADQTRGGKAAWVGPGGVDPRRILVLGAEGDVIVDQEGLEDTARFCGVAPVVLPGAPHDVMLDAQGWEAGAAAVYDWLRGLAPHPVP